VEDIFLVPDYGLLFDKCIDSAFGRTHKLDWTQHQWKFEAVVANDHFPHGAKATYRKYSSDTVIVIQKEVRYCCESAIGKLTGLEPTTLCSMWYPPPSRNRQCEGTHLLFNYPKAQGDSLPPMGLADDCINVFSSLQTAVMHYFKEGDASHVPARRQWVRWFRTYAPT
jgi:hypothetical protein